MSQPDDLDRDDELDADPRRRAAVYLRISNDRDNNRLGVDRHRRAALRRLKQRDWELVDVYEDNDVTGKGTKPRKHFERLMQDIEAGRIDVVVAQEWPRLERNRADGVRIIEAAQKHHILLSFVKGSDIDCSTPAGRLAADMFSAVARNEIKVKAGRQSDAQEQRALLGKPPKGQRPLGYAINGDVIEHEAAAVKAIYKAFRNGSPLRAIARALSVREGDEPDESLPDVPPLPRHTRTVMIERNEKRAQADPPLPPRDVPEDGPWSPSTVLGILRNPRYAGFSTYTPKATLANGDRRRTWRAQIIKDDAGKPVKGRWEELVDQTTWEAVQEMLDDPPRKTSRKGTHRRHLGSGLYRCGLCGHPVRGSSRGYTCKEGHLNRTGKPIDYMVRRLVVGRLGNPVLHERVAPDHAEELAAIKRTIDHAYAAIDKAQRDYDADLIEAADLKRKRERQRAVIDEADARRKALVSDHGTVSILGTDDPAQAFMDAELGVQRQVIDLLCEVVLHPQPRGRKGFDPDSVDVTLRGTVSAGGVAG